MSQLKSFTPREIVSELDRYIVGQRDAKRAVAIALRNRWRRRGDRAQEHHHDRPHRRRENGDRQKDCSVVTGPFHQG